MGKTTGSICNSFPGDDLEQLRERVIKLKALGEMVEIYSKYQKECTRSYDTNPDVIALWFDMFDEIITEVSVLISG